VQIDDPVAAGTTQVSIDVSMTPGNGAADMASDITPLTAAPDLVLYKSDGDISTVPGERISYALIAVNEGNMNAASTLLTETVPVNSRFDPANSSPDWACVPDGNAGSTCTADLATLVGATFEVRLFAVRVDNPVAPGTISIINGASLTAENSSGSSEASDETPLDVRLDLAATKADGGVTAIAGQMLSYTLGYANGGTQNASGVVLSETVPANTTFSSALSTAGWSCPDQAPAGTPCTLAIGSLAVGAQGSAMFAVKVDNPLPGGVALLSNTVTVSDDGNAGSEDTPVDNSASIDTAVVAAMLDLRATKVGILDDIAGVIDYTIAVENIGNLPDSGSRLTDALADPALNSAAAAWDCSASGGASCAASGSGPIDLNVNLPVGSSLTVLLSVPLVPGTMAEEIFNTATITSSTPGEDVNPVNNSDTSRVIICLFCDGFEILEP
jgi:large repetitive protein